MDLVESESPESERQRMESIKSAPYYAPVSRMPTDLLPPKHQKLDPPKRTQIKKRILHNFLGTIACGFAADGKRKYSKESSESSTENERRLSVPLREGKGKSVLEDVGIQYQNLVLTEESEGNLVLTEGNEGGFSDISTEAEWWSQQSVFSWPRSETALPETELTWVPTTEDIEGRLSRGTEGGGCSGIETVVLSRVGLGLTLPPEEEEWEQVEWIFLMDNELSRLPVSPKCPRLSWLFLQRNYCLKTIPLSFFEHMPLLQVLNLSKTRINALPPSLFKLVNLQELILRDCERLFVLPSEVGALKHLQVLDLLGTEIIGLPNEIGELMYLRYLQLSFYGCTDYEENNKLPSEFISLGIISKLPLLEDLSISVEPEDWRWNKSVHTVLEEVASLNKLTYLQFYFPEVELLERFIQLSTSWKDQRLRKFRFIVGHHVKRFVSRVPFDVYLEYEKQERCLRFVNGDTIPNTVLEVLTHASAFYLDHHCKVYSLSEFGVTSMSGLHLCMLSECPEIGTILDGANATQTSVLPLLEYLSINYLVTLSSLWQGSLPQGSLGMLKSLTLHTCPKLSYIFVPSMLQHLSSLEELVVEDCRTMKEIIVEEEILCCDAILLPRLKRLSLHYLPKLVRFSKGLCHSLKQISIYNCPNLKNLCMDIKFTYTIEEIKGEKKWWDALEWEESELSTHLQPIFFPLCGDDI